MLEMIIEFYVGPSNEAEHNLVIDYLTKNNYTITGIHYNGDHYSDISVKGDYSKFFTDMIENQKNHISTEYFDSE